jgi:hypothetical protein
MGGSFGLVGAVEAGGQSDILPARALHSSEMHLISRYSLAVGQSLTGAIQCLYIGEEATQRWSRLRGATFSDA